MEEDGEGIIGHKSSEKGIKGENLTQEFSFRRMKDSCEAVRRSKRKKRIKNEEVELKFLLCNRKPRRRINRRIIEFFFMEKKFPVKWRRDF